MKKVEAKTAKATVSVTEKQKHIETTKEKHETVGDTKLFEQPTCNVGVQASTTINTGNFCNVKVGVTLNVPCLHTEIDDVFLFAKGWVDGKMEEMMAEIHAANPGVS